VQNARDAAQIAYDEGRTQDALRIVQSAFQRAASNPERALYLSMEGSILYTLNNREGARAAWQRALTFDPSNLEVNRMMNFLDSQQRGQ
jgi:predicted negative regulator of RcsB-dependent stress response